MRSRRRELRWESQGGRRRGGRPRRRRGGRESPWAGWAPAADSRSPRPAGLVSAGAAEARLRGGRWSGCLRGLKRNSVGEDWRPVGARGAFSAGEDGFALRDAASRNGISRPPFLAKRRSSPWLATARTSPGKGEERRPGRALLGPGVTHRYENVKVVEISVQPTAAEEIVSEGKDSIEVQLPSNTGEIAAKKEEQTLNDLVNLLQDVVKNIPTELVLSTEQPPTLLALDIVTSPSVAVDTVWVNVSPQSSEKPRTIALMKKDTPTTTAFWKLRNDPTASVILHSNTSPSENLPSETSESVVLISEEASPGNTLGTISIQVEKEATTKGEGKSFDQLTNGALASLVESLKNVQKLDMTLDNNEPQQKSHPVKLSHHKPRGLDILEAIDTLIKSIKNAPSSVKEDPALHEYVEEAEGYLKNALELAGEAERKLLQKKEQQMKLDTELLNPPSTAPPITEMKLDVELPSSLSSEASEAEIKLDVEITPSPSTVPPATQVGIDRSPSPSIAPSVTEVDIILSASESLEKKAEDTEKEMGKLKAFINLLYGFSPELTEYTENSPHKKMAQDIVERSMEVLDAIKSVFCENPKKQSKQILKQLLQKDMELVRQAMKEKRAS